MTSTNINIIHEQESSKPEVSEARKGSVHESNSQGASSSNTAPYKYITTEYHYIHPLRSGIDSLYLSFKGAIFQKIEEKLQFLKEVAQNKTSIPTSEATFPILDHFFEVKAKGSGKFAFVLEDNWFRIEISSREAIKMPLAYVQIRSELLTYYSLEIIHDKLTAIIEHLGKPETSPTISRIDICLDFTCTEDFDFREISDINWRTKAHLVNSYWLQKALSGFSIGKGQIVGRIYNKLLEIKTSGKDYLLELWQENHWDSQKDVWRVEFQFRREFLQSTGIYSLSDFNSQKSNLWHYATQEWLQLVIPNNQDSNSSRWPIHPAWQEISQSCLFEPPQSIKRVNKERIPSDHYLFVSGLAVLTSYMAKEGISEIDQAILGYLQDAKHYHEVYLNQDFKAYLNEKAQEKAKRYNTIKREPKDE